MYFYWGWDLWVELPAHVLESEGQKEFNFTHPKFLKAKVNYQVLRLLKSSEIINKYKSLVNVNCGVFR